MYRAILEPIVRSPELPKLLGELQQIWQEEQLRRQAFYDWVTPDIKAEFIEGEVIVHSPVRSRHNVVLQNILFLLATHIRKHDLGYIGVEKIMCRFPRNDYEPDLCFFDKKTAQAFTDEQTIFPIPQLIVEVLSSSTESRDRGVKFNDYEANGVQEYWVVNANTNLLEQYILKDGSYELVGKLSGKAILQSSVISNFKVPIKAFFDAKANIDALKNI